MFSFRDISRSRLGSILVYVGAGAAISHDLPGVSDRLHEIVTGLMVIVGLFLALGFKEKAPEPTTAELPS